MGEGKCGERKNGCECMGINSVWISVDTTTEFFGPLFACRLLSYFLVS